MQKTVKDLKRNLLLIRPCLTRK